MFEKVIAHHVTIIFPKNTTAEVLMRSAYRDMLQRDLVVEAVSHYAGEHVHAVGVTVNNNTERPLGGFYHVTVSLEAPAKPVDSNKLTHPTPLMPFRLTGTLQLVD